MRARPGWVPGAEALRMDRANPQRGTLPAGQDGRVRAGDLDDESGHDPLLSPLSGIFGA